MTLLSLLPSKKSLELARFVWARGTVVALGKVRAICSVTERRRWDVPNLFLVLASTIGYLRMIKAFANLVVGIVWSVLARSHGVQPA